MTDLILTGKTEIATLVNEFHNDWKGSQMKKTPLFMVFILSIAMLLGSAIMALAGQAPETSLNDNVTIEYKLAKNIQSDTAKAGQIYSTSNDFTVALTHTSDGEIYGYIPGTPLSFLIQSGWHIYSRSVANGESNGQHMTKISYYIGKKTVLVQAGQSSFYIKGFITSTGVLTSLTADEKKLLKDTMEHNGNIELGEHVDFFLSSLNALSSWPGNMLVFIWNDDDKVMSAVGNDRLATMPRKDFNARNTDAMTVAPLERQSIQHMAPPVLDLTATDVRESGSSQTVTNICYARNHLYIGRYFECDDYFCIDRTYHNYRHLVGGYKCFGRCGVGCSGLPNARKYTRDCFNHDSCVQKLGTDAMSCEIMFTFCVDDVLKGRNCPPLKP